MINMKHHLFMMMALRGTFVSFYHFRNESTTLPFFKMIFDNQYQSFRQFGSRSVPVFCQLLQAVCKCYQPTTKVAASRERVQMLQKEVFLFLCMRLV